MFLYISKQSTTYLFMFLISLTVIKSNISYASPHCALLFSRGHEIVSLATNRNQLEQKTFRVTSEIWSSVRSIVMVMSKTIPVVAKSKAEDFQKLWEDSLGSSEVIHSEIQKIRDLMKDPLFTPVVLEKLRGELKNAYGSVFVYNILRMVLPGLEVGENKNTSFEYQHKGFHMKVVHTTPQETRGEIALRSFRLSYDPAKFLPGSLIRRTFGSKKLILDETTDVNLDLRSQYTYVEGEALTLVFNPHKTGNSSDNVYLYISRETGRVYFSPASHPKVLSGLTTETQWALGGTRKVFGKWTCETPAEHVDNFLVEKIIQLGGPPGGDKELVWQQRECLTIQIYPNGFPSTRNKFS